MDLSSVNSTLNKLSGDIKRYLDNPPKMNGADYQQMQDPKYMQNQYNEVVQRFGDLLDLIREIEYFISLCRKGIKLLSGNSELEQAQKSKLKGAIDLIKELSNPLYTEKERIKTFEMFYRGLSNKRDF